MVVQEVSSESRVVFGFKELKKSYLVVLLLVLHFHVHIRTHTCTHAQETRRIQGILPLVV